jgi:hypothetical protein
MAPQSLRPRTRFARTTRLPFLIALSVLILIASAACTPSEWRELAVSEAGFRILMRGDAVYVRQELDTPGGRMSAHLYSSDRPDAYYAVGYSDYPLAIIIGAQPEEIFAGVRDTWLRRTQGKLISSNQDLKLADQHPGMEFTAEGKSGDAGTFVQARLYLVDQRLFQVIAMGPKQAVPQGTINRYLNSFALIPTQAVGSVRMGPAPR